VGVGDELMPRMSTVMQKGWTCAHLMRHTYLGCLKSGRGAEGRDGGGGADKAAAERVLAKGEDAVRVARRRLAGRPTYYLTADCDDVLTKVTTHTYTHTHTLMLTQPLHPCYTRLIPALYTLSVASLTVTV
jgi:hypothetical protein